MALGPLRVAHVSGLHGALSKVTARVVDYRKCMGWRQMQFSPRAWWPPVTYDSGATQINVSALDGFDVGIVKEIFGVDPDEAPYYFLHEFGGGVQFPGHLTYRQKERSAAFSTHEIEVIPQQTGYERPSRPGNRRVFADDVKVLSINISQTGREL